MLSWLTQQAQMLYTLQKKLYNELLRSAIQCLFVEHLQFSPFPLSIIIFGIFCVM